MAKYTRLTPEALTQAVVGDNLVSFWFRKGHGCEAPLIWDGRGRTRLLQGYVSAVSGTQCRISSDTGRGAWWVATDSLLFSVDPLN